MGLTTPTARGTPVGRHMDDGYQTLLTFSSNATLSVWEKGVKPFGYDGGAEIQTSTMLNSLLHTFAARKLIKCTPLHIRAAWDPRVNGQLQSLINVNQQVDNWLPNGGCISFFGYLQRSEASEHVEGNQPEMDMTVVVTNTDPNTGAETLPVYHPPGGTGTT